MAGSFAIFELLGIENTFNVLPAIILPALYQFFGIDIAQEIREGQTIIPGKVMVLSKVFVSVKKLP